MFIVRKHAIATAKSCSVISPFTNTVPSLSKNSLAHHNQTTKLVVMKKTNKKILSLLLSFILTIGTFVIYSNTSNAAGNDANTVLLLHGEDMTDSSTTPHTITNNGGVTTVAGQSGFGNAMSFNGSSRLQIGYNQDFNFGTDNFTEDLWFKSSQGNAVEIVLFNNAVGHHGAGQQGGSSLFLNNGNLMFYGSDNGGAMYAITTTATYNDGNWHHVAIVRSSINLTTMYVDGINRGTSTATNAVNLNIPRYLWRGFLFQDNMFV